MGLYCYQARILKKTITDILDKVYDNSKDSKIVELKTKMLSLQHTTEKQTAMQAVVYLVLVFFPYMYVNHDYFLPISWFQLSIMGYKAVNSINENKNKNSNTSSKVSRNSSKEKSNNNKNQIDIEQTHQHPQPTSPTHHHEAPASTTFNNTIASVDVTSVAEVDENSHELLLTGNDWKNRHKKKDIIVEE